MKKNNKPNVYKFIVDDNGQYVLTAKGNVNLYGVERILGKVKVKGDRKTYELIEIKNRYFDDDGYYLTEREKLTFDIVARFVTSHDNGDRSVQHRPFYDDLKDKELLDDLGMEVLTYKHYYSGNDFLADCFMPMKKIDVTEELIQKLKEKSEKEEQDAMALRESRLSRPKAVWESL